MKYQLRTAKGMPNGFAGLDSTGKIPMDQLPSGIGGGTVTAPFTGNQATGSFTVATGQFGVQGKRLSLTGSQRATVAGTGRLRMYN